MERFFEKKLKRNEKWGIFKTNLLPFSFHIVGSGTVSCDYVPRRNFVMAIWPGDDPDFRHPASIPVYIRPNADFIRLARRQPQDKHRVAVTHTLVDSLELMNHIRVLDLEMGNDGSFLQLFHTRKYLSILEQASYEPEDSDDEVSFETMERYGLDNCTTFGGMLTFSKLVVAGAIIGARELVSGRARVVFWAGGGWPDARKEMAANCSYVNDVVIACKLLSFRFPRILFINFDVEHCEAVEDTFFCTDKVCTVLFRLEDGEHYSLDDDEALVEGSLEGRGTAISIPLRRGIDDDGLVSVFAKIVSKVVVQRYQPAAVLARCSGSVLAENRASGFNVSEKGLARCAQEVFSWKRPTMFFGGDGSQDANFARAWVAMMAESEPSFTLSKSIPFSDRCFGLYKPRFELGIKTHRNVNMNENTPQYLEQLLSHIEERTPWGQEQK